VKFEVKAGKDFDGEVTVVVKVESERKSVPFRTVLLGTAIGSILLMALVAIAYGVKTGDYAIIKAIAGFIKDVLVEVAEKLAKRE
jgi:hypothetical protein